MPTIKDRARSILTITDTEQAINDWLASRGVNPESPGMKRHVYFDTARFKLTLCLSTADKDSSDDHTQPSEVCDSQVLTMRRIRFEGETPRIKKLRLPGVKQMAGYGVALGIVKSDVVQPSGMNDKLTSWICDQNTLDLGANSLLARRKKKSDISILESSKNVSLYESAESENFSSKQNSSLNLKIELSFTNSTEINDHIEHSSHQPESK